jgi:UDP-N-acetylglucosamine 2-epimerase (non-hydrolysing)
MKTLTVFGTRPEAIKLAPVIKELERHPEIQSKVCVTAQHREMLDPFLELFAIEPDWDLNIMKPDQSLFDVTSSVLKGLEGILKSERPDIVLIQGDTTTAFASALAAFYRRIPVGHVEAGLRSHEKYNPFPEEINRRLADILADIFFAPTERAKTNLIKEGIGENKVFVTGNTVIDALFLVLNQESRVENQEPLGDSGFLTDGSRLILVTSHRRESFGQGLENICLALKKIAERNKDVEIVYPVHLNPKVRKPVAKILTGIERIHLLEPLDYRPFVLLMDKAYMILTDSGGIQEEGPALNKPVLVMRNATERPEVIAVGAGKLVGTEVDSIVKEAQNLLANNDEYKRMAAAPNPYGDGHAAKRIVEILMEAHMRRSKGAEMLE